MPEDLFRVDVRGVEAFLDRLDEGLVDSTRLMGEIGAFLKFKILERTEKGIDAEGLPFDEYSKAYKRTRELVGLSTSKVDLFFGGSMLGAMTYGYDKNQVRLFFYNTPHVEHVRVPGRKLRMSKATNAEIAYYNDELRPFFSISEEEESELFDMVDEYIDSIIR